MARYRRKTYYKRKSGRWSSNLQKLNLTGDAPAGLIFGDSFTLAQNPAQNDQTVSQQFTVKNIEVSGQLESTSNTTSVIAGIEDITYYIMYVPEGYAISPNLPINHPEWIMAYKYIGQSFSLSSSQTQPPKIKSRLARKLSPGDSIIFLYTGINSSQNDTEVKFLGLVRWWTKAN